MPRGGGCGGRGGGGLLEPLVLAALTHEESHGYDLRRTILEMTDGQVPVDVGGLYRVLRRLEDDGLVTSAWAAGEAGPQRRDYRITEAGLARLAEWSAHLHERTRVLGMVADAIDVARGTARG
jgi:DNA-binding PadR family transcriptional regulator